MSMSYRYGTNRKHSESRAVTYVHNEAPANSALVEAAETIRQRREEREAADRQKREADRREAAVKQREEFNASRRTAKRPRIKVEKYVPAAKATAEQVQRAFDKAEKANRKAEAAKQRAEKIQAEWNKIPEHVREAISTNSGADVASVASSFYAGAADTGRIFLNSKKGKNKATIEAQQRARRRTAAAAERLGIRHSFTL